MFGIGPGGGLLRFDRRCLHRDTDARTDEQSGEERQQPVVTVDNR